MILFLFLHENVFCDAHWKRFDEMLPMSTTKFVFVEKIFKKIVIRFTPFYQFDFVELRVFIQHLTLMSAEWPDYTKGTKNGTKNGTRSSYAPKIL